jgi:hypothetical protein
MRLSACCNIRQFRHLRPQRIEVEPMKAEKILASITEL